MANITVNTDKAFYSPREIIRISENVGKKVRGQTLRVDIYNPDGIMTPVLILGMV